MSASQTHALMMPLVLMSLPNTLAYVLNTLPALTVKQISATLTHASMATAVTGNQLTKQRYTIVVALMATLVNSVTFVMTGASQIPVKTMEHVTMMDWHSIASVPSTTQECCANGKQMSVHQVRAVLWAPAQTTKAISHANATQHSLEVVVRLS